MRSLIEILIVGCTATNTELWCHKNTNGVIFLRVNITARSFYEISFTDFFFKMDFTSKNTTSYLASKCFQLTRKIILRRRLHVISEGNTPLDAKKSSDQIKKHINKVNI